MQNNQFSVTLGNYKGLHYSIPEAEISDKEVEEVLVQERNSAAKLVTVGKAAELGDTVVIDYAGFCDGKQFEGGTSNEPYPLELGSHSFIPGFEEQLVGAIAGEKRDVNVTFPEQYHAPDLAGKEAVFKCMVHAVQQNELPALSDAFAKEHYNLETLDDLRKVIREDLQAEKKAQEMNKAINTLIRSIVDGSEIKLTDAFLTECIDQMMSYMNAQLQQQGADIATYCQFTGITEEKLREQVAVEAETNGRTVAVLAAIAEEEQLEVTDEDIESELTRMAGQYGMQLDQLKSMIPAEQIEDMKNGIRTTKAVDFVMQNAIAD